MTNCKWKVLLVDDEPNNLKLLAQILQERYKLSFATDGVKALDATLKIKPDIVLLDIMMPEMDGYEVCKRLKASPETAKTPVIFVTAMGDVEDEYLGFEVGGVDYITKPVKPQVLKSRLRTHLELKNARDELEKQNEILIENARLRDDVERITRHDLKTPLNPVINYPKLMKTANNLTEKQIDQLTKIEMAGYRLLNMINLSLDLYKMEQGIYQFNPEPVDILPIITGILDENRNFILSKIFTTEIVLNGQPVTDESSFIIQGEALLFYSMLANLIKNALEASPRKEKITISLTDNTDFTIGIHNLGFVPKDIHDTFFEKYTTSGKSAGTGLGTYSAKLIAQTQGASISMESSEENGTTIIIGVPLLSTKKRLT